MSFSMDKSKLVKMLFCFAVMIIIAIMPPIEPLTQMGMQVVGIFIGTLLLMVFVDMVWPCILSLPLFALTGVMTVPALISASWGHWITLFLIMSFAMTDALNKCGFTNRFVRWFMTRKFVSRSPWSLTFSVMAMGAIMGCFLDPVPTIGFFMVFCTKIFEQLGFEKTEKYPHIMTLAVTFAIMVSNFMTPISHPVVVMAMGFYESQTGGSANLFVYMLFGIPMGIILIALFMLALRMFCKVDMSRLKSFDVDKILSESKPMELKEKFTVLVFFLMVVFWIMPGLSAILAPGAAFTVWVNKFNMAFWASAAVAVMLIVQIDKKPVMDQRETFHQGVNWGVIIVVAGILVTSPVLGHEAVGLNAAIAMGVDSMLAALSPFMVMVVVVLINVAITQIMGHVPTVTLMSSVALPVAIATQGGVNVYAMAMLVAAATSTAYMLPSCFAGIALLHKEEYAHTPTILKWGVLNAIIAMIALPLIGYPFAVWVANMG